MTPVVHVISFITAKFDVAGEKPNPINPIAGESVLHWLRERLAPAGYTATEPDAEDWGWYVDVLGADATYLLGASGEPDERGAPVDWTLQVHKRRSLRDRITGRNRMTRDDPLVALIERIVSEDPGITDIHVDRDA